MTCYNFKNLYGLEKYYLAEKRIIIYLQKECKNYLKQLLYKTTLTDTCMEFLAVSLMCPTQFIKIARFALKIHSFNNKNHKELM